MNSRDELERALDEILAGRAARELESETLEFKEGAGGPEDSVREAIGAAICFANGHGGWIVLGVADKPGGPSAVRGTTVDPQFLRKRIYELSKPALIVEAQPHVCAGKRLVIAYVPQSQDIHSDPQGRATRRIATDCLPMTAADIGRLRDERTGIDWSAFPSERTLKDARPAAISVARNLLAAFPDERRKIARLGDEDLLRALGVLAPDKRFLRAGEVLFCGPPTKTPTAIVYQYRQTQAGEPRAIERLDQPLLPAFQKALELINVRMNVQPIILPDGQQLALADFPDLAVREAMANAVVHRDYRLSGSVQVDHSPEVFSVSSPGPLVAGVTPLNILTHPSKPRNPVLARAVRVLWLAEEVGRGVDRMYREMIRAGRDAPKIEEGIDYFRVTLVGGAPRTQIVKFVAQLPEHERDDTDTMLVLYRLCTARTVDAKGLSPTLQKGIDETETALRRMASDSVGILEPTRETARRSHPSYRLRGDVLKALGSAIPYQRRTVDDIDRKVIAHVVEYGTITNKTVQNLLDVDIQRARGVLADLVERKLLKKISEHERGPGVQYGPGKAFPPKKRSKQ